MRKAFSSQLRLDCLAIEELQLNLDCRDEIIPILEGLRYAFGQPELRDALIELVAADITGGKRDDTGRVGFDYWQIIVMAVVRLGCNVDYDKLQDLCENHRALRCLLGSGDWDKTNFAARRIRNTLCLLQPGTLEKMNHLVVAHGQQLEDGAAAKVRADSFVVETNIHYPTESGLIWDGLRKLISVCINLAPLLEAPGWRQARHLRKKAKRLSREVARISASKSPQVKATLNAAYAELLTHAGELLARARALENRAQKVAKRKRASLKIIGLSAELSHWMEMTAQVCDTAYRRTQLGEKVPNEEKLFSLFEPHTQLYRRGKAGQPNQLGRMVLIYEDGAGFISHYHLMARDASDASVACEQTKIAQQRHNHAIKEASFDRGFYSKENEEELIEIIDGLCLPPSHRNQYAECMKEASLEFRNARQRHPGIESAIGALQSGNGLERCRDKSEVGFERYLGLAILGRNIQVLGKVLIARRSTDAAAAHSKRKAA